MVMYCKVAII